MILIQFTFLIFLSPPLNIQLLHGEVIPATKGRRTRLIGTDYTCPSVSSRPVMEIKITLSENYLRHRAIHFQIDLFSLSFITKDGIFFASTLPDSS
jgi:hypothetical protein